MAVQERLYTVKELEQLPDDGMRHELLKGRLITMPPPKREHGAVVAWTTVLLTNHVEAHQLGTVISEIGFLVSENPDTVLAPDVSFISTARLPEYTGAYDRLGPDLVVEVISPANTAEEMSEKVEAFFAAGTRLIWIIYPKARRGHVYRSVKEVMILDENDTLDAGDVVPGFSVPVKEIFRKLAG